MQFGSVIKTFGLGALMLVSHVRAATHCNDGYITATRFGWSRESDYKRDGADYKIIVPAYNSATTNCILNVGDSNESVKRLQIALNKCAGQSLTTDGEYGALTKAAVTVVQNYWYYEGTIDGIYGPDTREAMSFYGTNSATGLTTCTPY